MSKIGMMLSGCGVQDGSEISEAVLTLMALERAGAEVVALAPDVMQAQVWNHYNGQETREEVRGVLAESARIVRGKITSVNNVGAHDLDALIIVGGYGVAKNLCTYATNGTGATVNPEVERLIVEMNALGKPIGAMCIASVVVALALQEKKFSSPLSLTIGNDADTARNLGIMGVKHHTADASQICIDEANSVVSTPAFMLASGPYEAQAGIFKLVDEIAAMSKKLEKLI